MMIDRCRSSHDGTLTRFFAKTHIEILAAKKYLVTKGKQGATSPARIILEDIYVGIENRVLSSLTKSQSEINITVCRQEFVVLNRYFTDAYDMSGRKPRTNFIFALLDIPTGFGPVRNFGQVSAV